MGSNKDSLTTPAKTDEKGHDAAQGHLEVIQHLRLDFFGCKHDVSLDSKVRQALLRDGVDPIIRGQITPAAGESLGVDIVVSVVSGIAVDLIVKSIKALITKINMITSGTATCSCALRETIIETNTCDYIVKACPGAGIVAEDIDYNRLISQMMEFQKAEETNGNAVNRIEAPCDVASDKNGFTVTTNGVGSFSLWLVTYRCGGRWPSCLYDAANNLFLPISGTHAALPVFPERDIFYRPEN